MAVFIDEHGGGCACSRDKCSDDCVTYKNHAIHKMTNGDRIRKMSNDEMVVEYIRIYNQLNRYSDSWAWLKDWLNKEVEGG